MGGIQVEIPKIFSKTKIGNELDFEKAMKRLLSLPNLLFRIKQRLEEGMRAEMTYAEESMRGVDQQFQKLQENWKQTFFKPFQNISANFGNAEEIGKMIQSKTLLEFKSLQMFIKNIYR